MFDLYYEKLIANIPAELISDYNAKSDIRYVYSAMHGVGYKFVEKSFEVAHLKPLIAVAEQRDADPDFPTVKFPNPEEGKSSLVLSILLAKETGTKVILANDPDADRLALAEFNDEWVFISTVFRAMMTISFHFFVQWESVESIYWQRNWRPPWLVVGGML